LDRVALLLGFTLIATVRVGPVALVIGPLSAVVALALIWIWQIAQEAALRARYGGCALPAQLLGSDGDCDLIVRWWKSYRPRLLQRMAPAAAGTHGVLLAGPSKVTWVPTAMSAGRGAAPVIVAFNETVRVSVQDLYPKGRLSCCIEIKSGPCVIRLMTQNATALRSALQLPSVRAS
jgi:hypothetical protein